MHIMTYGMWYLSFSHIVSLRYALSLFLRMAPTLPVLKWLVTRCKLSRWKIMEMSAWVTWRCRYKRQCHRHSSKVSLETYTLYWFAKLSQGFQRKPITGGVSTFRVIGLEPEKLGLAYEVEAFWQTSRKIKLVFQEPKLDESNPDRKVVFLGKFTC